MQFGSCIRWLHKELHVAELGLELALHTSQQVEEEAEAAATGQMPQVRQPHMMHHCSCQPCLLLCGRSSCSSSHQVITAGEGHVDAVS